MRGATRPLTRYHQIQPPGLQRRMRGDRLSCSPHPMWAQAQSD